MLLTEDSQTPLIHTANQMIDERLRRLRQVASVSRRSSLTSRNQLLDHANR